jgi:alpha-L-arabinofuranosidase
MFSDVHQPNVIAWEGCGAEKSGTFNMAVTASDDGKTVSIRAINRSGADESLQIALTNLTGKAGTVTVERMSGALRDLNTAENPTNIVPGAKSTETLADVGSLCLTMSGYEVLTAVVTVD